MNHDTDKGAAVYSPLILKLYDRWVLGISNRYAWRCSTSTVLLPFFRQHVGQRHLDVGVGTGFYPARAMLPASTRVTLMDLNPDSLRAAQRRLQRDSTQLVLHDVMTPLPGRVGRSLDSISLFYLLHCLPGTMAGKGQVFGHLKWHLASDGVLYGATILGDEAGHNSFGRRLMPIYNRKGIFGNRHDTRHALELALRRHFAQVDVRVEGTVALFEARQPVF
ncbi:class I SAM-dependent methyltransferase [Rhodanobacter glycinis]|uniref:Class I SAM-dependent methyltransferase n=1 Tax=Rhodanobacter glycinis TaxID=582702 RepID=A0A502C3G2_9GAMM|nr:methyltransferase [Rhodanobacter glycinis]TPG07282.1 class I SAM-dependent methyltransferase [Rhodanobacter glycinis]